MSMYTVTSSVRALDLPAADYAPCCGQAPEVITWPRGMGRGLIGVLCRNPQCPNHQGVLGDKSDIQARWARFRREDA